jgi:hypothetical protein
MLKHLIVTAVAAFVVASLVSLGLVTWVVLHRSAAERLPNAVVVYCFHGGTRCPKCEKIESQTWEVLEKSFAGQLKKGRLVWRVVDYDDPDNAHFKDDYKIVASSIVLVDARKGHKPTAKNLQQEVWDLVDDKEAFAGFMRSEIKKALK